MNHNLNPKYYCKKCILTGTVFDRNCAPAATFFDEQPMNRVAVAAAGRRSIVYENYCRSSDRASTTAALTAPAPAAPAAAHRARAACGTARPARAARRPPAAPAARAGTAARTPTRTERPPPQQASHRAPGTTDVAADVSRFPDTWKVLT